MHGIYFVQKFITVQYIVMHIYKMIGEIKKKKLNNHGMKLVLNMFSKMVFQSNFLYSVLNFVRDVRSDDAVAGDTCHVVGWGCIVHIHF